MTPADDDGCMDVERTAKAHPSEADRLRKIETYATAVWVSSAGDVAKVGPALDAARREAQPGKAPVLTAFALYDLPDRDIVFATGDSHRDAIARACAGVSRWLVLKDVPLMAQIDGRTIVIGQGWNALTPVCSRSGASGLFTTDAALSQSPIDDSKHVHLAVLATILGNLLELKRHDASAVPWSPPCRGERTAPRAGAPRRSRKRWRARCS
jgi:hypothetical protein